MKRDGTLTSTERFVLGKDGLSIFHQPTTKENADGTRSVTLGFRVCIVDDFTDPALVCKILNLGYNELHKGEKNVPAIDSDD